MHHTTRTRLIFAWVLASWGIVLTPVVAWASVPGSTAAVNTDTQMVAIHGYDTVAYFTDGHPVMGDARYRVDYNGVHYDFASQDHADKFRADPAAYIPQFGGFCAIGTSYGEKVDIDPLSWRIVGGKLYLNFDPNVQKLFNRDVSGTIARANEQWPLIKNNKQH